MTHARLVVRPPFKVDLGRLVLAPTLLLRAAKPIVRDSVVREGVTACCIITQLLAGCEGGVLLAAGSIGALIAEKLAGVHVLIVLGGVRVR